MRSVKLDLLHVLVAMRARGPTLYGHGARSHSSFFDAGFVVWQNASHAACGVKARIGTSNTIPGTIGGGYKWDRQYEVCIRSPKKPEGAASCRSIEL